MTELYSIVSITTFIYPFCWWIFGLFLPFICCDMLLRTFMCVHILVFYYFGHIPRSGISGPHGNSVFNFLRNHCAIFHSSWTILRFHQWYTIDPIFPHPLQRLFSECFFIAILVGVKWYLIMVFICISLSTYDIKHLLCCWLIKSIGRGCISLFLGYFS